MSRYTTKTAIYAFITNTMYGVFFFIIMTLDNNDLQNSNSELLYTSSIWKDVCVSFLIGIVLNNFGSIVLEPILKKIKFIRLETYEQIIKVSKIEPEIVNSLYIISFYRTLMMCTFIVFIMGEHRFEILLASIIFLLSYKKETQIFSYQIRCANHEKYLV